MAKEIASDISIQAYSPKWASSFAVCLDSVAREKKYLLMTEGLSADRLEAFVKKIIEGNHIGYFAIQRDQGQKEQVVAWCDIKRHDNKALRHSGELGMGVLAGFRGRGIGRLLLDKALDDAWAKGFAKVELSVYTDNKAAVGLYKNTGFLEEGLLRRHALVDGEYKDSYRMGILNPQTEEGPRTERGIRS